MSDSATHHINIQYGRTGSIELDIDPDLLLADFSPPAIPGDAVQQIADVLERPLNFPALAQAVIPDDHVTFAVAQNTPQKELIIAAAWEQLDQRDVQPENVTIVCQSENDPRSKLKGEVARRVNWVRHDADDANRCGYLASSTSGERIYIAREILEADVVVPIGPIGFDPLLGYSGTNSVFYPEFSNREAIDRSRGQGHTELGPDNVRPLRQLVDEISWLLGNQFAIQTIGNSRGQFSHILAGAADSVFRDGKDALNEGWRVSPESRADMVIVSVDEESHAGDWHSLGTALSTARRLVAREGRIVVVSSASAPLDVGLEMLKRCDEPNDALKPLRLESPQDVIPATQIINAISHARVYLLSEHDPGLVEDLFMTPLSSDEEVKRLLASEIGYVSFVNSAQNTFGEVLD